MCYFYIVIIFLFNDSKTIKLNEKNTQKLTNTFWKNPENPSSTQKKLIPMVIFKCVGFRQT